MARALLSFLLLLLIIVHPAHAQEKFQTQLHQSFIFSEDGTSEVIQKYTLTNLTSDLAASSYEFDILDALPDNLQAYDRLGKLDLKTTSTGPALTRVSIPFTHITAGKGKTYDFYISFKGPSSHLADGLRKMDLPLPTISDSTNQFTAQLDLPLSFGRPLAINPAPATSSAMPNRQIFDFNFSSPASGTIYAVFGQKKLQGFTLDYPHPDPSTHTLELPSDKSFQNVFLEKVTPQPLNVTSTQDGRWLALYPSSYTGPVTVVGYALISPESQFQIPTTAKYSSHELAALPQASPPRLDISWHKPWQFLPFPVSISEIIVTNTGSYAMYHIPILLESSILTLSSATNITISSLPPSGWVSIPVKLTSPFWPSSEPAHLTLTAPDRHVTYNIEASRFILWYVGLIFVITISLLIVARLTNYAWGLHFQKQSRRSSLRR